MREASNGTWRVRGIRGATTAESNSRAAIDHAVTELLDALEAHNPIDPEEVVNVIFSATPDLDAVFPAQIARKRPGWDQIPLLDVQQMIVVGSLPRCVRVLIQINTCLSQAQLHHVYLNEAEHLRPDLSLAVDPGSY